MRKLTVQVKQEHIDAGKWADPYKCPIALAVREVLPDKFREHTVWVMPYEIVIAPPYKRPGPYVQLVGPLPPAALEFMRLFDDYREVTPFTFTWEYREGGLTWDTFARSK